MRPTSRIIDRCGSCGGRELRSVLWLGYMQPACSMPKVGQTATAETHYPLELLQCQACSLVQLSCIVDPEVIFYPDYPYSSGNTLALRENFVDLAIEIQKRITLRPDDLVVDIGSNDGTLLSNFKGVCRMWGIEPTNQAETAYRNGIPTTQALFTSGLAVQQHSAAQVITACNVLAHVADVHDVLDGVYSLLADDGLFVTENHYLGDLIEGNQWDFVYHEHLRYYSLESLTALLGAHGLQVFRARRIPSHGGSFRIYAGKQSAVVQLTTGEPNFWPEDAGIEGFAQNISESKRQILKMLSDAKGRIVAVGAAARGATLLNHCGIDVDMVEAVAEVKGSNKIGRYMPGTRIPVVDEASIFENPPDYLLILPWHLADGLIDAFRARGYRGDFLVPDLRVHVPA